MIGKVKTKKLTAYSYIRWSSDQQTKGDSFRRQEELAEKICKDKGWILDPLRRDEGVSAYTGENIQSGNLGAFLRAVQDKRIKTPCILIIETFDRLTRLPPLKAFTLVQTIINEGVTICTANDGREYSKSSYENLEPLLVSLCQFNVSFQHSESLSRRLKASWVGRRQKAIEDKFVITRKLPAWIKLPKKAKTTDQFVVDEEKANIVRRIYKEYLEGVGTNTIALNLTRDKIKAFETQGEWNVSTITKWLSSQTVIGHLEPHSHFSKKKRIASGEIIRNYYPAIISEDDFYRAQEYRKKRLIPRGPKRNKHNLFTGIIKCSRCGGSMSMRTGAVTKKRTNPYRMLICGKARRGGKCKFATVPYLHLEDIILNTVFSSLADSMSFSDNRPEDKILALNGRIAEKQKKIENITNLIESGDSSCKTLLSRLKELEKEIDILELERRKIPKGVDTEWLHELHNSWKPLENNIVNRNRVADILRRIIKSINIDATNENANIEFNYRPDTIAEIKWSKKDKKSYYLNGVQIPKAPSQVWLNPERIIPNERIQKVKKGLSIIKDVAIYDSYIVFIRINSELTPFKAILTKNGLFYVEERNAERNSVETIFKDIDPPVSVYLQGKNSAKM
jgi:DNA invertase Pin-like site-specific DNA recombinase